MEKMFLPEDAKRIINLLTQSSYSAYAVGGCVRDAIMGRTISDYDITTSALPNQVEEVLRINEIKFVETGLKHGTITAIINHKPYEITTFRTDGEYSDYRHPESVSFVNDIKEDLSRRDFTVNAIAYNDSEGFVDLFGGREDIKRKVIKTVGEGNKRFQEDALRIMRALRFSSQLGFSIEEQTKEAVYSNKELLKNIAKERIFVELKKLLSGDNCSEVLSEYSDVIKVIIPEITMVNFQSISLAPKNDCIRLALLLMDCENPSAVLKRLRVSNEILNNVANLIEFAGSNTNDSVSIKRLLNILGEELFFDLIQLKKALLLSNNKDTAEPEKAAIEAKRIIQSNEPYKISDLAVNGFGLKALGFEGKEISDTLEKLLDEVIKNPDLNKKEELILIANKK